MWTELEENQHEYVESEQCWLYTWSEKQEELEDKWL
jgi:hypothetical protein